MQLLATNSSEIFMKRIIGLTALYAVKNSIFSVGRIDGIVTCSVLQSEPRKENSGGAMKRAGSWCGVALPHN